MDVELHLKIAKVSYITLRIFHMIYHFTFLIFTATDLLYGGRLGFFICTGFIFLLLFFSCLLVIKNFEKYFNGVLMELSILGVSFFLYIILLVHQVTSPSTPSNSTNLSTSSVLEVNSDWLHSTDSTFINFTVSTPIYLTNESFNLEEDTNDQFGSKTAHASFKSDSEKVYLYYVLPSFISVIFQIFVLTISYYHRRALEWCGFHPLQNQVNPQGGANEQMNLHDAINPLNVGNAIDQQILGNAIDQQILGNAIDQQILGNAIDQQILGNAIDPPILGNAIDPPILGNAIDPPILGNAIDPPILDNAIDPPILDNAIDPPILDNAIDPPILGNAIDPPILGNAIDQQILGNAIDQQILGNAIDQQILCHAIDPPNISNANQLNQGDGDDDIQLNQCDRANGNQLNQGERHDNNQGERPDNNQGERPDNNQGERPDNNQGERPDNNQGERPDNYQEERPDNNKLNQGNGVSNQLNPSEDDRLNQVEGIN